MIQATVVQRKMKVSAAIWRSNGVPPVTFAFTDCRAGSVPCEGSLEGKTYECAVIHRVSEGTRVCCFQHMARLDTERWPHQTDAATDKVPPQVLLLRLLRVARWCTLLL